MSTFIKVIIITLVLTLGVTVWSLFHCYLNSAIFTQHLLGITKEEDDLLLNEYAVAIGGPGKMLIFRGNDVTYTFRITNFGALPDTYQLVGSSSLGWANLSTLVSEISLKPSEEFSFEISVRVPVNALPGERDELNIVVISKNNLNIMDSLETSTVVLSK